MKVFASVLDWKGSSFMVITVDNLRYLADNLKSFSDGSIQFFDYTSGSQNDIGFCFFKFLKYGLSNHTAVILHMARRNPISLTNEFNFYLSVEMRTEPCLIDRFIDDINLCLNGNCSRAVLEGL